MTDGEPNIMNVPFFGLQREHEHYGSQYAEIYEKVIRTGNVLQGPEVTEFEETVAAYVGRRFGVAVNSCTDALFFSLKAAGIGEGDYVLVTSFSFIASASSITRAGAIPVFCDIEKDTCQVDALNLTRILDKHKNRIKALVAVHLFGNMLDVPAVEEICKKRGLLIIEDAAQSFGAHHFGRKAGSIGDISCISFDPTKVIGAPGSGGIVLTDNENHAMQVKALRYHGKCSSRLYRDIGYNSQLPTATAAVLLAKIAHMEQWQQARSRIAEQYSDAFQIKDIATPVSTALGVHHAYHKYVVRCSTPEIREFCVSELQKGGVEIKIHYSTPLHLEPQFQSSLANKCPTAERCSATVFSLPIHPWLTSDEVQHTIHIIQNLMSSLEHKLPSSQPHTPSADAS